MSDLERWAQLSPDTIAAMERLRTSPSKPPMTEIEALRARVEALEATQHAHVDTSRLSETVRERIRQELSWPAAWQPLKVATETTYGTEPIVVPSVKDSLTVPAGSLVERVAWLIAKRFTESRPGTDCLPLGREVILEVAAWLRFALNGRNVADRLEQEANR
jgi:hypothetical protein